MVFLSPLLCFGACLLCDACCTLSCGTLAGALRGVSMQGEYSFVFPVLGINDDSCPLCGLPDSAGHILGECMHKDMKSLAIERHNVAGRMVAQYGMVHWAIVC